MSGGAQWRPMGLGDVDAAAAISDRVHGAYTEKPAIYVERLRLYVERRGWRPEAWLLLERVLQQGEVPRGDASRITNLKERSARELLGLLVSDGILGSDTPKGPVSLRFPMQAIELLFPSLFPET
jgi:hypothetical protein